MERKNPNLVIDQLDRRIENWKQAIASGKPVDHETAVNMYTAIVELRDDRDAWISKVEERE